jgi:hypothetical protein
MLDVRCTVNRMADQVRRSNVMTFRFDKRTMEMLRQISKHKGSSMSDVVRRLVSTNFLKEFGDMLTCSKCSETHVVKGTLRDGWKSMIGKDGSIQWLCPMCQGTV